MGIRNSIALFCAQLSPFCFDDPPGFDLVDFFEFGKGEIGGLGKFSFNNFVPVKRSVQVKDNCPNHNIERCRRMVTDSD